MEAKAIIFPQGNVAALRDVLQKCCDHPEIVESYRQTAADFICRKYNWDETVRETLELYRREEESQQVLQQVN